MPQNFKPGKKIVHRREAKETFAELSISCDRGLQELAPVRRREDQLLTYCHPARGAQQRAPFPVADLLGKQHFHLACGGRPQSEQPRGDDAAVVQYQHIAFLE